MDVANPGIKLHHLNEKVVIKTKKSLVIEGEHYRLLFVRPLDLTLPISNKYLHTIPQPRRQCVDKYS